MSIRRATESRAEAARATDAAAAPTSTPTSRPAETPAPSGSTSPRSLDEAEARYVASRDAWTAAMRAANSGRPADMASLAMAQEAYEQATAEVKLWRSGARAAIPIEPQRNHAGLQAAIGQEMAWRRVHEPKAKPAGPLSRLVRKISRRG